MRARTRPPRKDYDYDDAAPCPFSKLTQRVPAEAILSGDNGYWILNTSIQWCSSISISTTVQVSTVSTERNTDACNGPTNIRGIQTCVVGLVVQLVATLIVSPNKFPNRAQQCATQQHKQPVLLCCCVASTCQQGLS